MTGQEVALKLEYVQIDPSLLESEIEIYEALSGGPGIPRVYWHGHEYEYRVMAFELLGPNLENLFNYCSPEVLTQDGADARGSAHPSRKYIQSKGLIRRDARPET